MKHGRRVEVVLAGFIDYSNQAFFRGHAVADRFVDLAALE
jgi:hypothetical protein